MVVVKPSLLLNDEEDLLVEGRHLDAQVDVATIILRQMAIERLISPDDVLATPGARFLVGNRLAPAVFAGVLFIAFNQHIDLVGLVWTSIRIERASESFQYTV